ncbi:uncharacterized protein LOC144866636 isoform X2 [Branchiostoma floridae x Branchiostoma japonicum]
MTRSQAATLVLLVFCFGINEGSIDFWKNLHDAAEKGKADLMKNIEDHVKNIQTTAENAHAKWNLITVNNQRVKKLETDLAAVSSTVRRLDQTMRQLASQQNKLRGDVSRHAHDHPNQKPNRLEDIFHRTMSKQERHIKGLDRLLQQMQAKVNRLETTTSSAAQNNNNELRKQIQRNENEIKQQKEQSKHQEQRLMAEMNHLRSIVHNKGDSYIPPFYPGTGAHSANMQDNINRLQSQVSAIMANQKGEKAENERLFALISELQNKKNDKMEPTSNVQHADLPVDVQAFEKEHLDQAMDDNLTTIVNDLQGQVQRLEERPYVGHCEVGVLGLPWNADGKAGYGGRGSVTFSKTFRTVPVVSTALYKLYHTGNQPVGIVVSADDVTEKGFRLKLYGWDQTKLYSAGVQWMACG